ncbi:MAG: hypothetical protein Q7S39_04100 [Ignavibacteria bacterium]|nr:hypothetical protein [Ignavibacteria bacterium]
MPKDKRDFFAQRKYEVLKKLDKSSKKSWDEKILKLCEVINKQKDFYTTSSCSGRITLIKNVERDKRNVVLKSWHDLINLNELKKSLLCFEKSPQSLILKLARSQIRELSKNVNLNSSINHNKYVNDKRGDINEFNKRNRSTSAIIFKQEPCILHVACRNVQSMKDLFEKAKLAGWKNTGAIAFNRRFILDLRSTEKLEFPIFRRGNLLVDEDFLKIVVEEANKNLKKGWEKIERLIQISNSLN